MSSPRPLLEYDVPIDDRRFNLPLESFSLVPRTDKIYDAEFKSEAVSYGKDVWRRFKRDRVTLAASIVVLIIVVMAVIGPSLNSYNYRVQNLGFNNLPPRIPFLEKLGIADGSGVRQIMAANRDNYAAVIIEELGTFELRTPRGVTPMLRVRIDEYKYKGADGVYYWFGSDQLGRDLFTRLWQGTRISLLLGVMVVAVNLTIGLLIGSVCGYYGGWVDLIIQRIIDIIRNIPYLPLCILLIMMLGSGVISLALVFFLTGWMQMANNVRVQFYRFKNREYVLASRTMGASDKRVMYKYILPNAVGTIITACALNVPAVVFQEAYLSYLGLGIQAPNPSIGMLLKAGQDTLTEYPYMIFFPGIVIIALMLAFNLFGNGLRDAFNPALRQ